jgi:hypothetical protein
LKYFDASVAMVRFLKANFQDVKTEQKLNGDRTLWVQVHLILKMCTAGADYCIPGVPFCSGQSWSQSWKGDNFKSI